MIFNICEALKNRDKQNDCKYDFLTTYQCNKYSNNTKKELIESLNNNCSDKKLEFILSRTANTEKIDLSEKFLEQFDSLNEEDSKPLNIHYYALVNTVKENGISKPTILNVCTASSIDKALMFLDPVDSEHVIEISEQKYDDYFKGQDILDEGAIWDAVKNGVKGVADAVKNINAERKNTDSYRIKQEIKDKKKDLRVAKEMEKAAKDSAKYGYHSSESSNQSNNSASSNSTSNDTNNNSNSTSFKAGSNPTFNRSRTSSNPSREEVLSPELIQQLIDSGDEATLQNIKIQAEKARQEAKKNNDKLEAEEKARKKQEEEKARKAAEADRAAAEAQSSNTNQNEEFTKMGGNLTEGESLKESLNLNEAKNIINVLNKNLRVRFKHSAGGIFSLDRTPFNEDTFNKLIKNNYKMIGDILEEQGLKYDISEDAYISKDTNLCVTIYGDTNGIIVQFEEMESESLKESVNSDIVSMIKKQFPKATVKTSVRKHSDVHKSNPDTPIGKTKYVDIRITPDSASSVNSILQYCNHNIKKVLSSDERFDYYGDVPARNPRGSKEVVLSYQDYSGLSDDEYKSLLGESINPADLTDCPACGDVSFDSKRGRCTKCNYREESLNEDTQLKFDDDMINDIEVLYMWRPEEVERILIKHGSDKNNDNWIDGLDLPAAYDEIMSTFRDEYSDYDEIDYDVAKVLGLEESYYSEEEVDESLTEGKDSVNKDNRDDIIFRLRKLKTEASEALRKYESLDNLEECRDILYYLVNDSRRLLDFVNDLLVSRKSESLEEVLGERKYAVQYFNKRLSKWITVGTYGNEEEAKEDLPFHKSMCRTPGSKEPLDDRDIRVVKMTESLNDSIAVEMSRDDFDKMCRENRILQGLSSSDYKEIRDFFYLGYEDFDAAVNDLWNGDNNYHSRDWYDSLLKKYTNSVKESLKEFLNNDITELEDGVYQHESMQLPRIGDKKKALSSNINQNEEFTNMNDIFKALNEADDCINKDTHLYEQDALTYKNDQDLEEKVARRLRQIFIDFNIDSSEAMQFSKWQEVIDWISSVIKQLKDTPLTEDLSQEEIHTSGISAYITDAINGEYDTINDYNEMLLALKDDSQDSAISVIEDIIKEEYTHIGQLQELLKMYASPSSEIKSGEVEAQKQIEETKDDQSDSEFDNEFGLNSGFDSFI